MRETMDPQNLCTTCEHLFRLCDVSTTTEIKDGRICTLQCSDYEPISSLEANPPTVSRDRSNIYKIIEWMLFNPDEHGKYPTTETLDKLEQLIATVRFEAVGWAWAEACIRLDNGEELRRSLIGKLVDEAKKDLNPLVFPFWDTKNE